MWWSIVGACMAVAGFVSALSVMRIGLEGMAEGRLPRLLHKCAGTPTRGILTGTVVTAILQSSSAVTAITVGLVAGGNLAFRDAVGIVLGANVGTTFTSQLLTFDLWQLAVPSLALGLAMVLGGASLRRQPMYNLGLAISGFAGILISLQVLVLALHPIAAMPWFADWLETAGDNPILAILTGCFASALLQSSTATTVITMALAMDQLIPLQGAIAIVLGANVGTCATSVIAAIGRPRAAQQVALAHVLLNVGGVLLAYPLLELFADLVELIGGSPSRQVANAHSLFNIVCTLLMWPFTRQFARLVERLLPAERRSG